MYFAYNFYDITMICDNGMAFAQNDIPFRMGWGSIGYYGSIKSAGTMTSLTGWPDSSWMMR